MTPTTKNRIGTSLFGNALLLGAVALVLLHKSAPQAFSFTGAYVAIIPLAAGSAALFIAAMIIYREPVKMPAPVLGGKFYDLGPQEMLKSYAPKDTFCWPPDMTAEMVIKRDGYRILVTVGANFACDGAYGINVHEAAMIVDTVRLMGCTFPKGGFVVLTEKETDKVERLSDIKDEIEACKDADDTEADNTRWLQSGGYV